MLFLYDFFEDVPDLYFQESGLHLIFSFFLRFGKLLSDIQMILCIRVVQSQTTRSINNIISMQQTNIYKDRKIYRCAGPNIDRGEHATIKRQTDLIFFKYVEARVLLVLLLEEDLVFFYFQPTYTLMNSFTCNDLQERLATFQNLREIFFYMQRIGQSKYNLDNNCLQIVFEEEPVQFQLQTMPKTTGHRKAELSGAEILSTQMDKHYDSIQLILGEKQKALHSLKQQIKEANNQKCKKKQVIQLKNTNFSELQVPVKRRNPKKMPIEIDLLQK